MLRLILILLILPLSVRAEPPKVVADIAPVHSLVQMVMGDVGEATLLLPPGASPHDYALRPSDARALQEADIIIWVGPVLSPWLEKPVESLGGARGLALLEVAGTHRRELREGPIFAAGDHDGDAHGDHGDRGDHGDEKHAHGDHGDETHDDHGHHRDKDADKDAKTHDDHGHHSDGDSHGHGHDGEDPHAWLDPENARIWVAAIATALSEVDPGNAEAYRRNAKGADALLSGLIADIKAGLADRAAVGFLVDHDAFGHFEARFGLAAVGSISDGHEVRPGAKRIRTLRAAMTSATVGCVVRSPETPERALTPIVSGLDVRVVEADALGTGLKPGADLYPSVIRSLAAALADCAE